MTLTRMVQLAARQAGITHEQAWEAIAALSMPNQEMMEAAGRLMTEHYGIRIDSPEAAVICIDIIRAVLGLPPRDVAPRNH